MSWKAIGQSVIGTAHVTVGKTCEDSVAYAQVETLPASLKGGDVTDHILVCCVSDGAGSATHAALAAEFVTERVVDYACDNFLSDQSLTEGGIYAMLEEVYEGLMSEAADKETELNEFSCTLLACIIMNNKAAFVQIGDGAIVRNDGSDFYNAVWWPDNGEYQNTTSFLVDDRTFGNARISIVEEAVNEVAIFSDGLQMLTLNTESASVHQPFFSDLFKYLRMADNEDKINVLNRKLTEYLDSATINNRTDDDKTLFMATRL
jgi:hypothetical protein